ncbi:hypothetical protein Pyrfu_0293 [Pyrolobus fumarii 1A]|uniref:Uncharacterized protein n=1 Tax=Pyrolobus fumarii (strain DSM 11204 / 1A) TaxID=694429 RepID=G0EFC2_PYRF1|nr:hypothetical protein [Pyrolobus fumarii]AEM38165.1 hypothetical protein Pyrfu_0293 [Pyrolobus fumarii 1A]
MLRSVSTIVGAIISLVALVTALAGISAYITSVSTIQSEAAKLTSNRLTETLYMRETSIEANTTTVCFHHYMHGLIRRVILVDDDRLVVANSTCIAKPLLGKAREVVLVSKNGGLLPIPEPSRLASIEGNMTLWEYLNGAYTVSEYSNTLLDILQSINSLNNSLLAPSDNINTVPISINIVTTRDGPIVKIGISNSVQTIPYSTHIADVTWYFGRPSMWDFHGCQPSIRFTLLDNDTLCITTVASPLVELKISQDASYTKYPVFTTVCIKRIRLTGRSLTILGTYAWIDSPLVMELLRVAREKGIVHVVLGAESGKVETSTSTAAMVLVDAHRADRIAYPVYDPAENILRFLPMYMQVSRKLVWMDVTYSPYSGYTVNYKNIIIPLTEWKYIVAPTDASRPGISVAYTPLVLTVGLMTGKTPIVLGTILATYTLNAIDGIVTTVFDQESSQPGKVMQSLYVPGFITYVDTSGASCKLIRIDQSTPIYVNKILGIGIIPGLVCVKSGSQQSNVEYYKIVLDRQSGRFVKRKVGTVTIPREELLCYYPYVLVCNGTITIYYSFAPSTLYDKSVVAMLNSALTCTSSTSTPIASLTLDIFTDLRLDLNTLQVLATRLAKKGYCVPSIPSITTMRYNSRLYAYVATLGYGIQSTSGCKPLLPGVGIAIYPLVSSGTLNLTIPQAPLAIVRYTSQPN